MTELHPITPPPQLIEEWIELSRPRKDYSPNPNVLATYAARWGADQELEACCKWLPKLPPWSADDLRKHRRPKPPSLAEEALKQLSGIRTAFKAAWGGDLVDEPIRRALERLQEMEGEQSPRS